MVAAQTFAVLWLMRLSAKLLVFFGAPNIPMHFLPGHLAYLGSYFRRISNPAAALVAVLCTSAIAFLLVLMALEAPGGGFTQTGLILLATLAVLAVFEHLALVVRLPDDTLWSWALRPACGTTNNETTGGRRNP
jgi:putative photosynthetic complex assembly protein 2